MKFVESKSRLSRAVLSCGAVAMLAGCAKSARVDPKPARPGRPAARMNILIIIADDLGVDKVAAYHEHPDPPPTPNIDALASRGVLFRNAYANPVCSPTRATILTGRYGYRYGVGRAINYFRRRLPALPLGEITLPKLLDRGTQGAYAHAAIGKWHLGSRDVGDERNPLLHGFEHFSGTLGNFRAGHSSYFSWMKTVDGEGRRHERYATSDQVDDAVARIDAMPQPWFLWLAFNAPHSPMHAPPAELHSYELSGNPASTSVEHYHAAVEAMDTEIGRLLDSIDAAVLENTLIVFVGDNGTPTGLATPPFDRQRAKNTVYEGGVNVPLIVAGPPVSRPGSECGGLINTTDLFATVAEAAGFDPADAMPDTRPLDSISIFPYLRDPTRASLRRWVYAEWFSPNGPFLRRTYRRMLRDERWKLIERDEDPPRSDEFYDLEGRFREGDDLLRGEMTDEQRRAYQRLKHIMETEIRRTP